MPHEYVPVGLDANANHHQGETAMRLTLRTLLAWMDDTLEPHQVREIGKQVAESPFAQELTDRINRVTRQRRLSVPSGSGADGTDANIVAGYLDNDLDPDGVAEFEKRCLTSDVNLAEAASVHQILSLLGQKVKVPDEARKRMYQLVKGRETVAHRREPRARPVVKEPVTKPIQPWVMPEPPKRPWIERFGPAAACLLLIGLSSWAAWKSLTVPPPQVIPAPTVPVAASEASAPAAPADEGAEKVAASGEAAKPEPATETPPAPEPPEPTKTANAADLAKAKPAAAPVVPAGSAGVAEKADGILLRFNESKGEWERLVHETPLKTSDRLLCLEPFRAAIDIGKIRIGLVRETEVRILSRPSDAEPAIELLQGHIVIRQPGSNELKVTFAKQTIGVEMSSDTVLGIERVDLNEPGKPVTQPQSLGVLCQQGEVTLDIRGKKQVMKASSVVLIQPGGQMELVKRDTEAMPPWLAESEPTPFELQLKDQFVKLFHADRPVLTEIVGAIDDPRPEVKQMAVIGLKSLGDVSLLVPILNRENDPVARRMAIMAIHVYMLQGPEASGRVRAALDEEFGENLGGVAMHMLGGYTPDEASRPDLYVRLVSLLSPEQPSVGMRELALDTLKRLTRRDDLGYNPDKPGEGKGFDAWTNLLQRNELRPPSPPPARPARSKTQR
jgi:hypothetical protein